VEPTAATPVVHRERRFAAGGIQLTDEADLLQLRDGFWSKHPFPQLDLAQVVDR